MIGKLIAALIGRSVAKKHGSSGLWGAIIGVFAPALVRRGSKAALKAAADRQSRPPKSAPKTYLRQKQVKSSAQRRRRRR